MLRLRRFFRRFFLLSLLLRKCFGSRFLFGHFILSDGFLRILCQSEERNRLNKQQQCHENRKQLRHPHSGIYFGIDAHIAFRTSFQSFRKLMRN